MLNRYTRFQARAAQKTSANARATAARLAVIVAVLLGAWGLLSWRIGDPWVGHQDENGAWISTAVRNYTRYGFASLKGIVVLNTEVVLSESNLQPYVHHPPLAVWWSGALMLLNQEPTYHESLIRFMTASATLMGIAALYAIGRRILAHRGAVWSVVVYALAPVVAYFGRMPDHEALAMLLVLLFVWVMLIFRERPTAVGWVALAVLTVGIVWTAWGGVIVLACVGVLLLITPRAAPASGSLLAARPQVIALGLVALAALTGLLLYYNAFVPDTFGKLLSAFVWRTSDQSLTRGSVSFTAGEYLARQGGRAITHFTFNGIALLAIGAIVIVRERTPRLSRWLPVVLLVGGVAYLIVFRNASYIHDYYLTYTAPGFALIAAQAITFVPAHRRTRRWYRPLIAALLITLPVSSLVYLNILYSSSGQTEPLELAAGIAANTENSSVIVGEPPLDGLSVAFYASRAIIWGTTPDAAADLARAIIPQPVFYVVCRDSDTLELPPALLSEPPTAVSENCWLLRLKADS